MKFQVDDPVVVKNFNNENLGINEGDQGEILSLSEDKSYVSVKLFQTDDPVVISVENLVKLKSFHVTIKASVTKTESVFAEDEDQAAELAHQQFNILNDDTEENYEQDTINISEEDQ